MSIIFSNIAARDQLPNQKDYKNILIATASASSSTGSENDAGNVLDSNENTKWTSKGMDESVTLQLSDVAQVHRIDIEWDPDLPRTGRFSVLTAEQEDASDAQTWISGNMDSALFTSIEDSEGVKARIIKIVCGGNADNDLNGITNIAVYGHDSRLASVKESLNKIGTGTEKTDKAKGK